MTSPATPLPPYTLDREQELMQRLVNQCPPGPDIDAQYQAISLLAALGELAGTLNTSEIGPAYGLVVSNELREVLIIAASLACHLDIAGYDGTVWPDGTRIGGDGACEQGHHPDYLFAELTVAAGWVAERVLGRHEVTPAPNGPTRAWMSAESVTELIARTWSLADGLRIRDLVRELISEGLAGHSDDQPSTATVPTV